MRHCTPTHSLRENLVIFKIIITYYQRLSDYLAQSSYLFHLNCGVPSFIFAGESTILQRHIRAKYITEDGSCKFCNYSSEWAAGRFTHILVHTRIADDGTPLRSYLGPDGICMLCGYRGATEDRQIAHVKSHILSSMTGYRCQHCTAVFQNARALKRHLSAIDRISSA